MMLAGVLRRPALVKPGCRYASFFDRFFNDSSEADVPRSDRPFASSEYHLALLGYVAQTMHPQYSLEAILASDHDFLMGHVLVGASQYLAPNRHSDSLGARDRVDTAKALIAKVETSTLEKWHVLALEYMVQGQFRNAVAVYETILRHDVSDLLALKCAADLYVILGDQKNLLQVVSRVLPQWSATQPGYSHLLSLQAYALSENGDHGAATSLAERAMSMHEDDAGAFHALLHAFEVQGKHQEGASLLLRNADQWETFAVLRTHIRAHFALFLLETGRYDRVMKILLNDIFGPDTLAAPILVDVTQIYWRLVLAGFPADSIRSELQTQWRTVLASADSVALSPLALLHAHTILSLECPSPVDSSKIGLRDDSWDAVAVGAQLGRDVMSFSYPVPGYSALVETTCEAISAYNEHRFADAISRFLQVRGQVHLLGGSKVEQELFDMLLIDAATRGGKYEIAHLVLNERINAKPQSAQYWATFANVMAGIGDQDGVDGARRMSYVLGLGQAGTGAA
ncbi:DNA polymerase epsilon subunit [Achlya hypogyna]|uniref:Tetratricopeptide repeat protein 38 n=1 Tax=Achlya hypogyna TaxID=1202772 RepID=A0A1V9Z3J9_ACHHY|nr:DNA polymerase epsilon subunit [Achlya hypogyna]